MRVPNGEAGNRMQTAVETGNRKLRTGGESTRSLVTCFEVPDGRFPRRRLPGCRARAGFSLLELMVVFLLIGVLASFSMPLIRRSVEQAMVDHAASDLKGIWTAERLYCQKYGLYAHSMDLLLQEHFFTPQPMQNSAMIAFSYSIASVVSNTFAALATPQDPDRWGGGLHIAQDGLVTGTIQAHDGHTIVPSGEIVKP